MKRPKKATHRPVNRDLLNHRVTYAKSLGYTKQKWVEFCEVMLDHELILTLYEARETVSKYVTVYSADKKFRVRFSNHKPIKGRELNGDCDFFVGHTHTGIRTTTHAIHAALKFFNIERRVP